MIRTAMILVLSLVLPAAAIAAPARLTDSQMDLVTAGLTVATSASAFASGNDVNGNATLSNRVIGAGPLTIGIGRADARASACCGDEADVATTALATGQGDSVKTHGFSFAYETGNGRKIARSFALVIVKEHNPGFFVGR
jgi:hypothetical protein